MVTKVAENRETQNKPRRVPVSGLRDILTVHGKDPNKVYRFVKDVEEGGSRIMQFKRAGYEFTDGSNNGTITVGEECVYKSRKSNGTIVRHPVEANKHGAPQYLYLMEIKKEWYDEDKAREASEVDKLEKTITAKQNPDSNELGQYGTVKINR